MREKKGCMTLLSSCHRRRCCFIFEWKIKYLFYHSMVSVVLSRYFNNCTPLACVNATENPLCLLVMSKEKEYKPAIASLVNVLPPSKLCQNLPSKGLPMCPPETQTSFSSNMCTATKLELESVSCMDSVQVLPPSTVNKIRAVSPSTAATQCVTEEQ